MNLLKFTKQQFRQTCLSILSVAVVMLFTCIVADIWIDNDVLEHLIFKFTMTALLFSIVSGLSFLISYADEIGEEY